MPHGFGHVGPTHWVLWVDLMADPTAAPPPHFMGSSSDPKSPKPHPHISWGLLHNSKTQNSQSPNSPSVIPYRRGIGFYGLTGWPTPRLPLPPHFMGSSFDPKSPKPHPHISWGLLHPPPHPPPPHFPSITPHKREGGGVSLAHWVLWVDLMADPMAAPSPTFYGVFL